MRGRFECFECGRPAQHAHHVVPRSLGGTRTIPLCIDCHSIVHGQLLAGTQLIKAGLLAARARGVKLGRPIGTVLTPIDLLRKHSYVADLLASGYSIRCTAKLAGCGLSTVQRVRKAALTPSSSPSPLRASLSHSRTAG